MNNPEYYTEKNAHETGKVPHKKSLKKKFQKFSFSLPLKENFFSSRQHLANPTHPPCQQTSAFGHPNPPNSLLT